jgi:OOP family OmpA-OmpF porin
VAVQSYDRLTQSQPVAAAMIHFETNSEKIQSDTYSILNELATALQSSLTDAVLIIAGHTDAKGSEQYNLQLSQRRAQSVKNYLVNRGIADRRLIARGYGEAYPMASNETTDGRALNRRSEFIRVE